MFFSVIWFGTQSDYAELLVAKMVGHPQSLYGNSEIEKAAVGRARVNPHPHVRKPLQ